MIDRMRLHGGIILLVGLAGSAAFACGPGFPWQLLNDRYQTLHDLPVDSFTFGAARLVPRPALRLPSPSTGNGMDLPTTESEEHRTLSAADAALVSAMRQQVSAAAAEAVGRRLPDGVRLYVAGAVAFEEGDCTGASIRFRRVLAVPASPGADRTLWASFMLGRALAACGDAAGAADAFRHTRALVDNGAADPLALALASFGEEARLWLRASGLPMGGVPSQGRATTRAIAALHQAATLYGEQAALGGEGGSYSLQLVAEALLSDKPRASAWLAASVRDPLLCHLLVLYALSATGPIPQAESEAEDVLPYNANFSPSLSPGQFEDRVLRQLSGVATRAGGLDGQDAGRLAALAYLEGDYDLADQFVANGTGPLAAWIRARLALQRYDLQAAAEGFDAAVRELAAHPDAMTAEAAERIRAESGIVALGRGDFQQAMAVLYPFAGHYWGDVAYLAERVLTTDELRRFVVSSVPSVPLLSGQGAFSSSNYWNPDRFEAPRTLRELLARRLMRDGRWADAAATFTIAEERREAATYADALARSRRAFWRTDRARAAWEAALIARQHGLELFGTEIGPDQDALDGRFDNGYGPSHPPSGSLVTANERWRYAASGAVPDRRFHYRFLAAQDAERAADALPPRSQAFAAVLCRAADWMFQSDDEPDADRLYRRYLAFGAIVPFATRFGGYNCPAPDFDAAARLRWRQPFDQAARAVHRHHRPLAAAAVALAVLSGAGLVRRRRRRA